MSEHRVQIFTQDSFLSGAMRWGWQCFTCGEEMHGFLTEHDAATDADKHGERI